jgi:hypothetical protein
MQRRTLLKLGVASSVAIGLAGLAAAQWDSPLRQGKLSSASRTIFKSVADAMLDGCLPAAASARAVALDGMLLRVEDLIRGLPGATQDELAELLSVLSLGVGRVALFGLFSPFDQTPIPKLQAQLQAMRTSSLGLRQQVYHAFHDIVNSAYFADAGTWSLMGYSGPIKL